MPGMNEAKSPAPTPVMVAMEPTSMVVDPPAAVDAVVEVGPGVAVLFEQATRVVAQATATAQRMIRAPARLLCPP